MRIQALLAVLASCANSGLGRTDLGTGTTDDTDPAGVQDCPWIGTWSLSAVRCGSFPLDEWYDTHDGASMDITQGPDGGCSVVTTITGETCTRTEHWTFSVPTGTEVEVTRAGIASCEPEACQFAPTDAPCDPGDQVGTETHTIDDSTGSLTVSDVLADTAPSCTALSLVTTWAAAAR